MWWYLVCSCKKHCPLWLKLCDILGKRIPEKWQTPAEKKQIVKISMKVLFKYKYKTPNPPKGNKSIKT